ncbi:hypothetical protein EDC04DRAFT_2892690 [Pisolithus marmoratus]|nr:hypothetical protein EDC04DRAFT_2892690 [Pisolithus marmoratus]
MLGSRYPQNICEDLRTLDETTAECFYGLPFWYWPSKKARKTLLAQIGDYLGSKDVSEEDGWLGSTFKKLFRDNNTTLREASSHLLALQWGVHTNTFSIALRLFLCLLGHPDAFLAAGNEIDKAIKENFGDLESFTANVNLQIQEKPYFALLTPAILKMMKFNAIFIPVRNAETNFQLKDQRRTVTVRKGSTFRAVSKESI